MLMICSRNALREGREKERGRETREREREREEKGD